MPYEYYFGRPPGIPRRPPPWTARHRPGTTTIETWNGANRWNPLENTASTPLDVAAALKARWGAEEVTKARLGLGQYYPRLWRPFAPTPETTYGRAWADSVGGARNVFSGMRDVFRVVEPDDLNAASYGHRIREVLFLACTECEAAWKAVLRENRYYPKCRPIMTTHDYVKVVEPLGLKSWKLSFYSHPEYTTEPYVNWNASKPTGSLAWYEAYNATKHNREHEFPQASLRNMIDAAAGLFVMIKAQFGAFRHELEQGLDEFKIVEEPAWPMGDLYVRPEAPADWTPINYPFV